MIRSRRRALLLVAGVATASLGVGVAAGSQLTSPADAAARTAAPPASRITVPVERRALESKVVTRGDTSFAGAVKVRPETSGLHTPAVVTGRVPVVGSAIVEGRPVLEITGRPVIALAGELPVYRSLRPGLSGPDVAQLEQALQRLGRHPGTVDERYDADTAAAVRALYAAAGYEPPSAEQALLDAVTQAKEQVRVASDGLRSADRAFAAASAGPSRVERVEAQNAVNAARRALDEARSGGDATAVGGAQDALRLALARQRDLLSGPDTSTERAAVDDARGRLDDARGRLRTAESAAGTPLPAAEVVFVPTLPRRLDSIAVRRGSIVDGPVMSVSGAALVVTAQVDEATAALLHTGMKATVDLPGGGQVQATVTRIRPTDHGMSDVTVTPGRLAGAQLEQLRAANVRVTIPVKSTRGKVLAVPVAALSAGPGGESRVEVADAPQRRLLRVEVGLAAGGYAEIRAVDGALHVGDQVVVGR